jgi:hypothetical protein
MLDIIKRIMGMVDVIDGPTFFDFYGRNLKILGHGYPIDAPRNIWRAYA